MRLVRFVLASAAVVLLMLPSLSYSTSYQYDKLGRLQRVVYENGTVVVYIYDPSGNRTRRIVQNTNSEFCADYPFNRADMAIILEKGMNGGSYQPPAATGTIFNDVAATDFAADFIEQLKADGITSGCGGGNYCPDNEVTRDQMAVFLLRAKHSSSYSPPAPTGVFNDVAPGAFAAAWIEQLAAEGITTGCGNNNYCPGTAITSAQMNLLLVRTFLTGSCTATNGCGATDFCPSDAITRAQAAVFLVQGIEGGGFNPPAATGQVFNDVADDDFAAAFIEYFSSLGITAGCGNNNYCPNSAMTRAQMAVFMLRAKHGSGYSPPSPVGVFSDVSVGYWAAAWVEQLAAEGISNGCGGGNFCPDDVVTRSQLAEMLVNAFVLQ